MKEFINKLIGRLEEKVHSYYKQYMDDIIRYSTYNEHKREITGIIEIVNELAEEYKNTNIITDFLQYARDNADNYDTNEGWSLADLIDLSIKYSEEYINTLTDTSSGWVACSERLPKEDGYYLITIRFYHLHNLVVMGCNFEDGKWLYMDGDDEVIAWQPLPAPYKEGVTENE